MLHSSAVSLPRFFQDCFWDTYFSDIVHRADDLDDLTFTCAQAVKLAEQNRDFRYPFYVVTCFPGAGFDRFSQYIDQVFLYIQSFIL